MQHVLEYAKDKVQQCILTCTTTNSSAFNLYQKLGFNLYGTDNQSIKVNNTFYDEYLMVKDFNTRAQRFTVTDTPKNPTLHRFSLLKNQLGKSPDIKQLLKDCIYHDISGPFIWQTIIHYIRLICYYLFNTGRYYEMGILLSTLNKEESRQLKFGLDTNDINDYMLSC